MKLLDQHAIVTGAGAGIGRAIALRFAAEGAKVVVADVNQARANTTVDEICGAGGRATAIVCDVSDMSACEGMIHSARAAYGPVDILVNCAGGAIVAGANVPLEDSTQDFIDRIIGVNLMGVIYLCRLVMKEMKRRHKGKILNFSSVRGIEGAPKYELYSAAKGAIISLTQSLAMDMGCYGVTVNAIAPGAINSRPSPGAQKNYLNRPGTCEEVASLALFLMSDDAGFITGETVVIDGGRTHCCLGDMVPQCDDEAYTT